MLKLFQNVSADHAEPAMTILTFTNSMDTIRTVMDITDRCVCVCVCVCACVRACVSACERACVCVLSAVSKESVSVCVTGVLHVLKINN